MLSFWTKPKLFDTSNHFIWKKVNCYVQYVKKTWDQSWNISCLFAFHVHLIQSCYKKQENPHNVRAFLYSIQQRTNKNIIITFSTISLLSDTKLKPVGLTSNNTVIKHWSQNTQRVCFSCVYVFLLLQLMIICWLKIAPCWTTEGTGTWLLTSGSDNQNIH